MKAILLNLRKFNSFSLIGLLSLFVVSCGSYQNSSYYDNDGIYGTNERPQENYNNRYSEQNLEQSNKYATQFKSMQNEYDYFTDVENYSSNIEDTVVVVYDNDESSRNYAGWGNNSSDVTINYYNNSGWGWNNWNSPYWGIGWNNWYGNNWGWGWNSWYGGNWGWNSFYGPNWGWGWNSWYGNGWYGNPYYGGYYGNNFGHYGRNYAYNGGRRGGSGYYGNSGRSNYNNGGRRNNNISATSPRNNIGSPRNNNPRNTTQPRTTQPRSNTIQSPRNSEPRNTSSPRPNNNSYSSPRSNSGSYSSPRSSSSSGSFGGGRSGGGSRGGRGGF